MEIMANRFGPNHTSRQEHFGENAPRQTLFPTRRVALNPSSYNRHLLFIYFLPTKVPHQFDTERSLQKLGSDQGQKVPKLYHQEV